MQKEITPKQKKLLEIIYDYIKNSGFPPSFEEMREQLGVVSNQSILDLLNKLVQKKLVKKSEGVARGLMILPQGCQILNKPPLVSMGGVTTAGTPTEAVAMVGDWQELKTIDGGLKQLNGELIFLRVEGDSMINAGINDGDLVLVKKQQEFISDDIVLARVTGDEFTIKRFKSEDKPPYIYLQPENPNYPLIPFEDDTELMGKILFIYKNGTLIPLS